MRYAAAYTPDAEPLALQRKGGINARVHRLPPMEQLAFEESGRVRSSFNLRQIAASRQMKLSTMQLHR
jgi:hypothetical protein